MAIFVNQTQGYFLLTNFKVMYSTLSAQADLQEIHLVNYLECVKFKSQQRQKATIMLVRNPYEKLVSFFEDKFIRHPSLPTIIRAKYSDDDGWQACQKIFFPYLKVNERTKDRIIAQRLKNTSFAQFIAWLPKVYRQDEHLFPQLRTINFLMLMQSLDDKSYISKPIEIKLKVDKLIKLENLDRDYMQQNLCLDISQIKNKNYAPKPFKTYFNSAEILQTVNYIYDQDFSYFDYPKYDSIEQLFS